MTFNPPSFQPPVLAVGAAERSNGRQQLGSGLVTHRGVLDANLLRATGTLYPQSGSGLELSYYQALAGGWIQAYNRDTGAFTNLHLAGNVISLEPQGSGGKVTLPAGTAQALLGSVQASSTWSVPATSGWYESDARANFTSTGSLLRVEYMVSVTSPTAGAIILVGVGLDGSPSATSLNALSIPVAGAVVSGAGVYYFGGVAAGVHRMSIFLYGSAIGGFHSWAYQSIWVTEQRA